MTTPLNKPRYRALRAHILPMGSKELEKPLHPVFHAVELADANGQRNTAQSIRRKCSHKRRSGLNNFHHRPRGVFENFRRFLWFVHTEAVGVRDRPIVGFVETPYCALEAVHCAG